LTLHFILTASILLQFLAAFLAVRLIWLTERITAWTLIALAITVMALRRSYTAYEWIFLGIPPKLPAEIICLVISVLVLSGVALIGPIFRKIRDSEESLRQSEERYRTIVETAQEGIGVLDAADRVTYINPRQTELSGFSLPEIQGSHIFDFTPEPEKPKIQQILDCLREGKTGTREVCFLRRDGSPLWSILAYSPWFDSHGRYTGTVGMITDITARKAADETIRRRVRQQAAVAELGQMALTSVDLQTLMNRIAARIAETLEVEFSKVLELLPAGNALRLRAGAGWQNGLIGQTLVEGGPNSQAGYTLLSQVPVIATDLATESRFTAPRLLRDLGVVSGLSVIIGGKERPFGVLGAHSRRKQNFTEDDTNFMQAMANILALAVERHRMYEALQTSERELRSLTWQVMTSQEEERKSLALELHEDLAQTLQALNFHMSSIKKRIDQDQGDLYKEFEVLQQHQKEVIGRLLNLSHGLSPVLLENIGLTSALKYLLEDFSVKYQIKKLNMNIDEINDLFSLNDEIIIYRIIEEVLKNISEHAATRLSINIKRRQKQVNFAFTDNGRGYEVNFGGNHSGQTEIPAAAERIRLLGGTWKMVYRQETGTKFSFRLPLTPPAD
jgi:PAS domain S-box-containing protein